MASLPRLHCLRILPILASLLLWCPVLPAAGEEARPYDPLRTMAALNQANLSTSYAGLLRTRDRDARDAAGAAARNQ